MEVVPYEVLVREWEQARVAYKRESGILSAIVADTSDAKNQRYHGGTSYIVKPLTPSGQHIGTLHEIMLPDGSVPHTHPKDYTRRDCTRIRASTEPRRE